MTTFEVFRDDGVYVGVLHLEGASELAQTVGSLGAYVVVAVDDFQSPIRVFVRSKSLTPEPQGVSH